MIGSAFLAVALAAVPPETLHAYAPGARVPALFALRERDREGGRTTPFFTHYRPNVSVEGGDPVLCVFHVERDGGHRPGETGEIFLVCPIALREGQRFEAFERRRPIGTGTISPPAR